MSKSKHAFSKGIENPRWKGGDITYKCLACGKINTKKRKNRIYKYCNTTCAKQTLFRPEFTPWNKGRKYFEIMGENHPLWKGGIWKENATKRRIIMDSFEYRQWRLAVFERDNYTCQECGAKSKENKRVYLQADHIKRFIDYPELRFEISNGKTLCKDCHKEKTKLENKLFWKNQFTIIDQSTTIKT